MKSFIHGTYQAYFWHDCRCDLCREYQRARVARNRTARRAAGNLDHGTRSAYDAGCRCQPCRNARREAYIRLEARAGR